MRYSDERAIGSPEVQALYEEALGACAQGFVKLKAWYDDASLPLLRLPEARDDLAAVADFAAHVAATFDDFIVLGTGGSNLGAKALGVFGKLNMHGLDVGTAWTRLAQDAPGPGQIF